jgi:hypothetical protein
MHLHDHAHATEEGIGPGNEDSEGWPVAEVYTCLLIIHEFQLYQPCFSSNSHCIINLLEM